MKTTQSDAILAALRGGRSLTPGDALREFGCARLAARIYDLREAGWPIAQEMVEVPTRSGKAHVARYWMHGYAHAGGLPF